MSALERHRDAVIEACSERIGILAEDALHFQKQARAAYERGDLGLAAWRYGHARAIVVDWHGLHEVIAELEQGARVGGDQ